MGLKETVKGIGASLGLTPLEREPGESEADFRKRKKAADDAAAAAAASSGSVAGS